MPPKKGRGRKDSDDETESDSQENIGTFETLRDEGEHFVHVANYKKAIDSFTKAMEFKPNDKQCLVARSKCFLQLGDAQSALLDAEMALDEEKGYIKALFQKAEALYVLGDFETSLVFFHRGHKSRPELQEFRLGIQKCQEAINNSIGTPESIQLEAKGDLSFFEKQEEEEKAKKNKKQGRGGYYKPLVKKEDGKRDRKRPENGESSKTVKQLLGQLYGDKEFLERLLRDESMTGRDTPTSQDVKNLILDGLEYLDTRTEFWRQQKPLYARKRDQELRRLGQQGKTAKHSNPTRYVLRSLENIDEAQAQGKFEKSLEKAKKVLITVESWSDEDILNRDEIIANLHSQMGNALLELGEYDQALDHHQQDLEIGENNRLEEARSRAFDNIGRVYARRGDYKQAVNIWERKLPLSKSALENAWLFHEIGRCYLEMEEFERAKDYGEKSLSASREAEDIDWTLHSTVLIAQSEVKLHEYQAASDSFEQALDLAQTLGDKRAEEAIKIALEDVNDTIVTGIRLKDIDKGSDRGSSRGSNRSRRRSSEDRRSAKRRGSKEDRDEKSNDSRENTRDSRKNSLTKEEKRDHSRENTKDSRKNSLSTEEKRDHSRENTKDSRKNSVSKETEESPAKSPVLEKSPVQEAENPTAVESETAEESETVTSPDTETPKIENKDETDEITDKEEKSVSEENTKSTEQQPEQSQAENEADQKEETDGDNLKQKQNEELREEEYREMEISQMRMN